LTKSCFQREPGRVFGVDGVGNQRAKTQGGHHTGSIREGYLLMAKVVAFYRRLHMYQLLVVLNGDRSTVGRPKVVAMQSTAIDLSLLTFPGLLHRLAAEPGVALRWY
jgi:hypothetical protein